VQRFRRKVHPRVKALMTTKRAYEQDRSKCIFEIVVGLHRAGATPDEIGSVLWDNPYFISKHGRDRWRLSVEIHRIRSKLGD
jgi:hypothetical protein